MRHRGVSARFLKDKHRNMSLSHFSKRNFPGNVSGVQRTSGKPEDLEDQPGCGWTGRLEGGCGRRGSRTPLLWALPLGAWLPLCSGAGRLLSSSRSCSQVAVLAPVLSFGDRTTGPRLLSHDDSW